MNIEQIEINLKKLTKYFSKETFIYDLLLAYDLPKASITRLKKGNLNLSKVQGEISWKKKLFFKEEFKKDLHLTISKLHGELKQNQRFAIVTDYKTLLAIDTKTDDKLDIALKELPKHYDFFLPWAGMEKAQHANENPADVKAAEKMAKLFDEIKKDNPDDSPEFIHGLNVFLSRLLFCFFAEDTHIFKDNQFTNAIDSHTQADGSDLHSYLDTLFTVLNTPEKERKNIPEYLNAFPNVNGGLFKEKHHAPVFTRSSRQAILNSGDQDWSAINPDIFGSMFQAVISVSQRGSFGQHYTSVPNIMKVIEPLFLSDLYEEFEKANGNKKKLNALLNRLHNIKIFDPACGSGNFLIIAYKELRILEMKIFKKGNMINLSNIHLTQFYGIEIDDFAHEIAKLALWLAEHQMNVEFFKEFGRTNPTLPLKEAGQIVQGNATRLDWEEVCPKGKDDEIYILGNPPYLGSRNQEKSQKKDIELALGSIKNFKKLDYIACWFYKASRFKTVKSAFVTTSSICQGEQVEILWPSIITKKEIEFAVLPFKWTNNAKKNAGVTVVIIGLSNTPKDKKLITGKFVQSANNINPYLIDTHNFYIKKSSKGISGLPEMAYGNYTGGCNELLLEQNEYDSIIANNRGIEYLIRPLKGTNEFLKNINRYCFWIKDEYYDDALKYEVLAKKIAIVKKERLKSKDPNLNMLAERPHQFRDLREGGQESLLIPIHSSERREYLPCGFLSSDVIIPNSAQVIYDSEPYIFSLLSSKIHFLWVKTVCGSLESRIRYSSQLGYNTFPFPPISVQRKQEITQCVFHILEEREKNSDKTLAELYDPDKMPGGLREAHHLNDVAIERCYRSKPFEGDEERLEHLFKLYEKMIEEEKEQGTLFAKEKKKRKKGK
tara:strand:+ start:1340 stop:4003 length:2664 start_codon:yes stop_codon:yes gene_type:complete